MRISMLSQPGFDELAVTFHYTTFNDTCILDWSSHASGCNCIEVVDFHVGACEHLPWLSLF